MLPPRLRQHRNARTELRSEDDRCLDLWAEVLLAARHDLVDPAREYRSLSPAGRERVQAAARAWFASRDYGVGTFGWVCSLFVDMEPDAVRERLGVTAC